MTLQQVAMINSGGFSVVMAQRFLTEALEQEKITCFVDKLGRTWSLDAYTNMAIRTGSRQSRNAGMLTKSEHDLYYVVPIGSTCPICATLEGRVYSKSGTNPNYPPLTELYGKIDPMGANDLSNSYLTIHPNCRHTLVEWVEESHTEEEVKEMREKSSFAKHPKDINPQSKKEIEEYKASQRAKAKFRATLNEYNEMQAVGIEVPKNFQNFINAKANKTEKYKEWKEIYKENLLKKMAKLGSNDWSDTKTFSHTKEEMQQVRSYANEKGVRIQSYKQFDGDTEILKDMIDEISELKEKYNYKDMVVINISNKLEDDDFAVTRGKEIVFNTKVLRDREKTNENIKSGNLFVSKSYRDISKHEFSHLLTRKTRKGKIKRVIDSIYNKDYELVNNEISEYASSHYVDGDISEVFAEIFVKYELTKGEKYKRIIEEVLK